MKLRVGVPHISGRDVGHDWVVKLNGAFAGGVSKDFLDVIGWIRVYHSQGGSTVGSDRQKSPDENGFRERVASGPASKRKDS